MEHIAKYLDSVKFEDNKHPEILPHLEEKYNRSLVSRLKHDEALSSLYFEILHLIQEYEGNKLVDKHARKDFVEKLLLLYNMIHNQEHPDKDEILEGLENDK